MSNTPIFDEVAKQYPTWIEKRINVLYNQPFKAMARAMSGMGLAMSKNKLGI